MNIGVVISGNDVETCWNALRLCLIFACHRKTELKFSLWEKGVEYQKISTEKFNTVEQAEKLIQSGGKIYACGSCIKSREQEGSEMCPISTMKDMYDIIKESDKIVTF